jgi:hypothetical protein
MTTSTKTYAEIAVECEHAFQNGGPKVYILRPNGTMRGSPLSGRRTLELADKGEVVYARRKMTRQSKYHWIRLGMGT